MCVQHGRHPHRLQRALRSQRRTKLSVGGLPGPHPLPKARNCELFSQPFINQLIIPEHDSETKFHLKYEFYLKLLSNFRPEKQKANTNIVLPAFVLYQLINQQT